MTDQRPRTYGMAVERDPDGRARDGDPGEAPRAVADPHPEFVHALPGEGRTILVEEESGVAFAEVTGAVTTPPPPAAAPEPMPAPMPEAAAVPLFTSAEPSRPAEPDWLGDALVAAGLAAAALLVAALRRASRRALPSVEPRDVPRGG
jgi:hypothetical protein